MNARDFFSASDFEKLLDIYQNKVIIDVLDTPFKKTIRVNGNTYSLLIYTGHYASSVFNGNFYVSCWYDFNHKGPYQSRDIYGGSCSPNMRSYQDFLEQINQILKRTPDYEEAQEEQLTFF